MKAEVPNHLQATRELLSRSLPSHPQEQAPPVPQELMAEFAERFAPRQVAEEAKPVEAGWIFKVRRFFAAPSFGLAAAAVLVMGLLMPQLIDRGSQDRETFRGTVGDSAADHPTRIVFIGKKRNKESDYIAAVENSQVFEPSALVVVDDLDTALLTPGSKVVIDQAAGTLSVYDHEGGKTFSEGLPKSADDLPAAIAAALTQL